MRSCAIRAGTSCQTDSGSAMARTRQIKPEFFKHERLAELSPLHRLLFIGLWCQADRDGRLEDRPMRLKVEILPYEKCDVDAMLTDLERHSDRLIVRYEAGGRHFIKIPHFGKHQSPHPKEVVSELPDLPTDFKHPSCTSMHEPCIEQSCQVHGHAPIQEGKEGEVGKEGRGAGKPTFEVFWREYPRKVDKQEAIGLWKKIRLDEVPAIMAGLQRWRTSGQWDDVQFCPSPARWLRRRKWEDEPPKREVSPDRSPLRNSQVLVEPVTRGAESNVVTPDWKVRAYQERLKREREAAEA